MATHGTTGSTWTNCRCSSTVCRCQGTASAWNYPAANVSVSVTPRRLPAPHWTDRNQAPRAPRRR